MQEIPIPDGNFLDREPYPGELTKAFPKISFMELFVSAPMPPGLPFWLCGAQDSNHHLRQWPVPTSRQALTTLTISDDICHKDVKVVLGSLYIVFDYITIQPAAR